MSDEDDITDGNESEGNAPKTLREQNKKLAAEKQELEQKLAALAERDRQRTVKEVLTEKKADPRIAKYALRELGDDVTEEAVAKWLESDGELFGYRPPTEGGDGGDTGDEPDAEAVREQERISRTSAGAPAPASGWTDERVRSASFDDLITAGLLEPK